MDISDPIKSRVYTEMYEKFNKNIKLSDKFVPTIKDDAITGKFYSKYEPKISKDVSIEFIELIERRTEKTPKELYSYKPPTINMEYGWFSDPLVPPSKDPRLHFAVKQSDVMKTEVRIQEFYKCMGKSKFTGTPFRTR